MAQVPFEIDIDEQTKSSIERLASDRRESVPGLVREALGQFIQRETASHDFARAGQAAWDAFEATGVHATHEEVDAWLRRLEAGQVVPPPECHG